MMTSRIDHDSSNEATSSAYNDALYYCCGINAHQIALWGFELGHFLLIVLSFFPILFIAYIDRLSPSLKGRNIFL